MRISRRRWTAALRPCCKSAACTGSTAISARRLISQHSKGTSVSSRRRPPARPCATTSRCSTPFCMSRMRARCISSRRRRCPPIRSRSSTSSSRRWVWTSRPTPTTATRPRRPGVRSARLVTSLSPIRICCIRASCRTTPSGSSCLRTCATSLSTRFTPIAACSAPTWPTSSAGFFACAGSTAPTRSSSAAPRRSPILPSLRRRSSDVRWS